MSGGDAIDVHVSLSLEKDDVPQVEITGEALLGVGRYLLSIRTDNGTVWFGGLGSHLLTIADAIRAEIGREEG